jgi:hypothetical protein
VVVPFVAALHAVPASAEERLPPVWGYGVQTCAAFVAAADGREEGSAPQRSEYLRYEDWLTGFVTGLNLATGQDVLVGADIEAAMGRILAHCRGHREQDFFAATMDLVRMLSGLK